MRGDDVVSLFFLFRFGDAVCVYLGGLNTSKNPPAKKNSEERIKQNKKRQMTKDAKKGRKNRQNSKTHRSNEALLDSTPNEVFFRGPGVEIILTAEVKLAVVWRALRL